MERVSFRDPDGQVFIDRACAFRISWAAAGAADSGPVAALLRDLQNQGKWIPAEPVDPSLISIIPGDLAQRPPRRAWRHPRLFFPCYPHEWSPRMLQAAGALTLDLNLQLLGTGWELKDASPANVLFEGPGPIFVDHLSPVPRRAGQLGWVAYGQFIRSFITPLCLNRLNRVPLAWIFLGHRDGIAPEQAHPQLSLLDRLRPSVFNLITLPAWIPPRPGPAAGGPGTWKDDEAVGQSVTARLLKGLLRNLGRWAGPMRTPSTWSRYDRLRESYSAAGQAAKDAFIGKALAAGRPETVLDLGCNTGRYAKLAARAGARVVAVDGDELCIDDLWLAARQEHLDILPLVMDLGRPSPALGWENREEASFLARAEGRFQMVFGLALLHHLLVRERVPLDQAVAHFSRLTTRWAVLEWVPPQDPQFQRLSGPNQTLYAHLNQESFEQALAGPFQIAETLAVPDGERILYLLEKRLPTT